MTDMKRATKIISTILMCCIAFAFTACNDDEDNTLLRNDCLKRTLGPNLVGQDIYFAYAMAVPYHTGKITSAQVEASIPGASETKLEHRSFHTDLSGTDVPVTIGNPCINEGNTTKVEFTVDTCASTLRYYYRIPEEAKGKQVSFTFSATASTGETVSMQMGPYQISKQDIVRDLTLTKAKCYISIENMTVYNAMEAAEHPDEIDLVYLWRSADQGVTFGHAFVAPAADKEWLPDMDLPTGVNRNVKLRKEWGMIDGHLTSEPNNGTYLDDIDFETIDLTGMPNYAINMKTQGGMWIETEDGKYRAYLYINSLKNISGGVISIKRYQMK